jgi:hypothetical protein
VLPYATLQQYIYVKKVDYTMREKAIRSPAGDSTACRDDGLQLQTSSGAAEMPKAQFAKRFSS